MKVFLDTNVILECKPLSELPWSDLGYSEEVTVLLVPTVLKEIDNKKRDGRLGDRARAFNKLISPAAISDDVIVIRQNQPRVELAVAKITRIDWDQLPELDPNEPDACIIAEVLSVVGISHSEKLVVSHDIRPLNLAYAAGVKAFHVSDDWLLPKLPSADEKEMARLKLKLKEVETTEPDLDIRITAPREAVQVRRFPDLSRSQRVLFESSVLAAAPSTSRYRSASVLSSDFMDYTLDDRLKKFRNETLPSAINAFSRRLTQTFSQCRFSVRVKNVGALRADRLIVSIKAQNSWLHDKYIVVSPDGPAIPHARFNLTPHLRMPRFPQAVGPHEIHFEKEPRVGCQEIEVHCEDFRQGREWVFEGIVTLDANTDENSTILVEVTASNLHGRVFEKATITKDILQTEIDDVIDIENGVFKIDLPMLPEIRAADERDEDDCYEMINDRDDD